jgi:O-succinylhomoserine sulfhydrylase
VLGGAVCGPKKLTEEVFKYLRTAGPTLSAFNAWVLLKGLETLKLSRRKPPMPPAGRLAGGAPQGGACFLSGLPSHPQHELAKHSRNPAAASFLRSQGRARAGVDRRRSLPAAVHHRQSGRYQDHHHPSASTTHGRISPEARAAAGINEGLLRIAVGLEAVEDLQADLERGLSLI